jgi:GNAT superfamily N-acetyltransferase
MNIIRDVSSGDRAAYLDMVSKFYSSSAVDHTVETSVLEKTFDEALSKSPYVRVLMIGDCGFANLSFTFSTEVGGLVVLLEDLFIDDSQRGKGLGSKFMTFMEEEYPQARRFRLEVTKDNTGAIELYKKLGFKMINYAQMVKDR